MQTMPFDYTTRRTDDDLAAFLDGVGYTKKGTARSHAEFLKKEEFLFGHAQLNCLDPSYPDSVGDARMMLINALNIQNIAKSNPISANAAAMKKKLSEYGIAFPDNSNIYFEVDGEIQVEPKHFWLEWVLPIHDQYAQYLFDGQREFSYINGSAEATVIFRIWDNPYIESGLSMCIIVELFEAETQGAEPNARNILRCCLALSDALFNVHLKDVRMGCSKGVPVVGSLVPLCNYWVAALEKQTKDPNIHSANCRTCGRPYWYSSNRGSEDCPHCRNWRGKHPGETRPYYINPSATSYSRKIGGDNG